MTEENTDIRPGVAFLLRRFGTAFIVSALAVLCYSWYSWHLHRRMDEAFRSQAKARDCFVRMMFFNETSAAAAREKAAGGSPLYGPRSALELEKLIKEASSLLPGAAAQLGGIVSANDRLAETERAALALAGGGRRKEALALLERGDYRGTALAFAAGVKELSRATETGFGAESRGTRMLFRREVLAGGCALLVIVLSWVLSVLSLRRGRGEPWLRLIEKEDDYRRFFDNVHEIFYRTDLRGTIKKVTPSVYRLAGYKPEEVLGRPVHEIYENPADRAGFLKELLLKGEVTNYELRLKTRDRGVVYAAVNACLTRDFAGVPTGVEGSLRDITAIKLAEDALKRRTEQLEAVIHNSPAAIIPMDRDGRALMWNKAAERLFGWSAAEAVGTVKPTVPEDKKTEFASMLAGLFINMPVYNLESRRIRKDGTSVDVSISAIPMRGKAGGIESGMAFITESLMGKRV